MRFKLDRYESPVGTILLATDDAGTVRALDFLDYETRMLRLLRNHYGDVDLVDGTAPDQVRQSLNDYFAGNLQALDELPVETNGTAFQRQVWKALRTIPEGETRTYGEIAAAIGRPAASRAVGAANGANPVAIIVPCHRVIGANGSLTGYGGGVQRKRWLLDHESQRGRLNLFEASQVSHCDDRSRLLPMP